MDEILKIIVKCNKERKLLDTDDIKKICHIVIKRNKYDFVKDVMVAKAHPTDESCHGSFYGDKIVFFSDGLIKALTEYVDKFTEAYQIDGSTVDILNYYTLATIFHELAHARQHYLINSK